MTTIELDKMLTDFNNILIKQFTKEFGNRLAFPKLIEQFEKKINAFKEYLSKLIINGSENSDRFYFSTADTSEYASSIKSIFYRLTDIKINELLKNHKLEIIIDAKINKLELRFTDDGNVRIFTYAKETDQKCL